MQSLSQAQRMAAVQMPVMGFVADLMRENPGTISLGQGVVHYGPPQRALEAAHKAIELPQSHLYGYVIGQSGLREALAGKMLRENHLDPGFETVVTAGSNMAFFESVLAITDPGDEVILISPYYFNHEMAVRIASCTPVVVSCGPHLVPELDTLASAITPRTRAIVTISPNNPTGVVYSPALLGAINTLCAENGLYHISDEAYEYFTFEDTQHCAPGRASGAHAYTISLYSMSKAYGMAGWRLGYMAIPPHLLPAFRKIQDTNPICPSLISQAAAMAALEVGPAYCQSFLNSLAKVRTMVLEALQGLGDCVRVSSSNGAFYVFVEVDTPLDAKTLTARLIRDCRVAVIPGDTFGASHATYIRIAYGALQPDTLAEAMDRLCTGLTAIQAATPAH